VDRLFRLAEDDQIGKRSEWHRIGKGEGTAADHQRIAFASFRGTHRDPGEVQHLEEPGQLELVADREREASELADGAL